MRERCTVLAGGIASRAAGFEPGDRYDLKRARELALCIAGGDEETAMAVLDRAAEETRAWLAEPEVAQAVEVIKTKLLERGKLPGWRASLAIEMRRKQTAARR